MKHVIKYILIFNIILALALAIGCFLSSWLSVQTSVCLNYTSKEYVKNQDIAKAGKIGEYTPVELAKAASNISWQLTNGYTISIFYNAYIFISSIVLLVLVIKSIPKGAQKPDSIK